jgi:hypothetical protein
MSRIFEAILSSFKIKHLIKIVLLLLPNGLNLLINIFDIAFKYFYFKKLHAYNKFIV